MMSGYNIRVKSMFGTNHSWSVVMRALCLEFAKANHNLYLESVNGYSNFNEELKPFLRNKIFSPNIDLAYTLPRNFSSRFMSKSKLKMAIYNYESSILPKEWVRAVDHIDYALPSSNYSKRVFTDAGWPEEKCIVVPHGIFIDDYKDKSTLKDITKFNKFTFLNISIPHYRKNIASLVEAYYSEFKESDGVNLVLKTSLKKPKLYFECDVQSEIQRVQKKFDINNLPQITVVVEKYPSIVPVLNSCHAVVSASSSEGFGMPLLEGMAAEKLVISPNCTGQLDFLNKENSILYDAKEVSAPDNYQYWRPHKDAKIYMPNIEALAFSMRNAYENYDSIQDSQKAHRLNTVREFSWENAAKKIVEVYEKNI
jgi:glycosyltransferase involved in cell wall biosynthesis